MSWVTAELLADTARPRARTGIILDMEAIASVEPLRDEKEELISGEVVLNKKGGGHLHVAGSMTEWARKLDVSGLEEA